MDFSSDDEVSDSELFNVDDIDFSDIVVDDEVDDEEVDFSAGIDAGIDDGQEDMLIDNDDGHEDLLKALGDHLSRLPENKQRLMPSRRMWRGLHYIRRINDKVLQQSFLKLRARIILLAHYLRGNPSNAIIEKIMKHLGKLINITRKWVEELPSNYITEKFTFALWYSTRLMYDLVTVAQIKQDHALEQIYGKGNFRYVSNWVQQYTEELEDIYEIALNKDDDSMAGDEKEMNVDEEKDELQLRF